MFSEEAIKLAKSVVEAIKRIAERQKGKCPECKGTGEINQQYRVYCEDCKGTGKVKGKWEWEPEEGDHIVLDDEVYLLFLTRDGLGYDAGISCGRSTDYSEEKCYDDFTQATKDNCISLLHWERIDRLLEGMGYSLGTFKGVNGENKKQYQCIILGEETNTPKASAMGKTRQEAVMQAVIELGKED